MHEDTVRAAVEAEFRVTGADTPAWPDPHQGEEELDEAEYSRVSDPAKYRIIGARVEAWIRALTGLRLAIVQGAEDGSRLWRDNVPDGGAISRERWVHPHRTGGLSLLVCTSGFEGVTDNAVLLGTGTPAVEVAVLPDCGCDACDGGSAELVEELDDRILDVLTGAFVHVTTPSGTVQGNRDGWSATGLSCLADVERVLVDARAQRSDYPVVSGTPWW